MSRHGRTRTLQVAQGPFQLNLFEDYDTSPTPGERTTTAAEVEQIDAEDLDDPSPGSEPMGPSGDGGTMAPTKVTAKPVWLVRPRHLAEVKARVEAADIPGTQRSQMLSAIKKAGEVVGKPLDAIPADIPALRALLEYAAPGVIGMKANRWGNVLTWLLAALRWAGVVVMPGRDAAGMSDAWRGQHDQLQSKRLRNGLSRILSHFTREGVEPDAVTLEHFEGYREALIRTSLHAKPQRAYYMATWLWNQAVGAVPSWPQVKVELPTDPRRISFPLASFPESFRIDFEAFLISREKPSYFRDSPKKVKASTADARRKSLLVLASAAIHSGLPIAEMKSLASLVEPQVAEAALLYLLKRDGKEQSDTRAGQADLLKTVAKYWVKNEAHAAELKVMAAALRERRAGMTEKNHERLRQFDLEANQLLLFGIPRKVLGEVEALEKAQLSERSARAKGHAVARRLMFALAVQILSGAPVRIDNLVGIELDRHLKETRRGRESILYLEVPGVATKTGAPIRLRLSPSTAALIARYVQIYRPRLIPDGGSRFLFPGRVAGRRTTEKFSCDLSRFIFQETGLRMNPHLFRHLAAKVYLKANPHDVETVRQLLGHSSTRTTLRSYADFATDHATDRWDQTLSALLGDAEPPSSHRRHAPRPRKA